MNDYRYQMVTCQECGTTYRCVPTSDFYERVSDGKMVCEPCLLGYPVETARVLHDQHEKRQAER